MSNVHAGAKGTATVGDKGTATAGDYGTATAGAKGTATAGDNGTATAGEGGTIIIPYSEANRWRVKVGYIGESGPEPDTPYKLDEAGKFVAA